MTSRRGRRCSAAVAFLRPAMKRGNLTVLTYALAHKVLFEGKRAVGVQFPARRPAARGARRARSHSIRWRDQLRRSFCSSRAGGLPSFSSSMAFRSIEDAPAVGANLQDHLQVRMVFKSRKRGHHQRCLSHADRPCRHGAGLLRQPARPIDLGRRLRDRLLQDRSALRHARLRGAFHSLQHRQDGGGPAFFLGLHGVRLSATAREPRLDPDQEPGSDAGPGDPHQLSRERDGQEGQCGFAAPPARDRSCARDGRITCWRKSSPARASSSDDELLAYCRERGSTIYHPTCSCMMGPGPNSRRVA